MSRREMTDQHLPARPTFAVTYAVERPVWKNITEEYPALPSDAWLQKRRDQLGAVDVHVDPPAGYRAPR